MGGGSQFSYTTTCSASLLPAGTCAVVVTFAPLQVGSASATITVRTVDRATSSQAGTLLGLGLATADLLLKCAGSFPDTVVGVTSPNTITCTLTNTAATASGAITSTPSGDFAIATDNCKTANLQNNTSCTLIVSFTPTAKGDRTGAITVTSANSGTTNQQLTGVGLGIIEIQEFTTGNALVKVGNYDFGQVTVGQASTTNLTLAVFVRANVGNLAVTQNLGTPADFTASASALPTWPGQTIVASIPACPALTSTAPPITADSNTVPYCVVVLVGQPSVKGARTGSVVATGASAQTDTGTFKETGTGPITLNPSPLTFASVAVGDSKLLTLTVANGGTTPVTAASYTLTGTDLAQFVVVTDGVSGQTITSGAANAKFLEIRFIPASTGAKTASLTVSGTYAGGTETAQVDLTGTGGAPAQITGTLSGAFADTAINATSAAVTVTVSNGSGSAATGKIIYFLNDGAEFTLTPPSAGSQGTCGDGSGAGAGSNQIAAGGTCTILVWFKPVAGLGLGKRTATLSVQGAPGGQVILNLSGNATPQLTVAPATIQDFGKVVLADATSATKTITFTNFADHVANLTVGFVANQNNLTPSDPTQFQVVTNNCATAVDALGGTCTIVVRMLPSVAGVAYATLEATDTNAANGGGGQKADVDVTGNGQNPASLEFTDATAISRNFGQIRLGTTSAPVTYTVTNTGDVGSGHLSFGLYDHNTTTLHAKTADFVMTGTTCSADTGLNAKGTTGSSCNIVVAYNPTACTGVGCTSNVDVDLVVKATPGSPTGGLVIGPSLTAFPELVGTATASATTSAYLVESTTGVSPYTFPAPGTATTLTVTMALHNGSGGPIDASGTPVISGSTEFAPGVATATPCTDTLLANGVCTFTVIWTPVLAAGVQQATVTLAGAQATLVAVNPNPANLVATPTAGLDFGTLLVGTPATLTLTVTNDGDLDTTGNLVATKGGTDAGNVTVLAGGCQGAKLLAGASCTLSIRVTPSSTTSKAATVTVTSGAVNTGAVSLKWVAIAAALITPDPTQIDFGTLAVQATSDVTPVTLTNVASGKITGPLSISVDNTDFAISAVNPAGYVPGTDCADPVFAKGLNDTTGGCTIYVTFTPSVLTPAAKSGTITVTSTSGATAEVVLQGQAKAALSITAQNPSSGTHVETPAPTVTFASTAISGAHPTVAVTFTNDAKAPMTGLLLAALSGTDSSQYRIILDGCTGITLAAGATCSVTVRFDPTTTGTKAATLTVSGTPGNSASTSMTGTATNAT